MTQHVAPSIFFSGRVEVTEVRDDKPICKIQITVRNEADEPCLTGTADVYTVPLPSD